jgi:chemotaxis protein methyltransferase CheR
MPAEARLPPGLPLAQGELAAADARELRELKALITARVGFYCEGYKEKCLRRRLAVRMRARGAHRYAEYGLLLEADEAEFQRLLNAITINVSKFFRNPEVWDAVLEHALPVLEALPARELRIWSAGCAGGEEPLTAAMLLAEAAEAGVCRSPARYRILATDVDPSALAAAERGEYPEFALSDTSARRRERWFPAGGPPFRVPEAVRRAVTFRRLDLITDALPAVQHLVVCRNVIIYFERPVQEQLFARFADAIVPGGFLLLGKVETIFGPAASAFRPIRARERLFQRI